MVVMLGGLAGGQLLLNVADPASFELFVLISVLVSLALIPILLTARPAPDFTAPSSVSLAELYRISPLGVFGALGTGMAHGALFGMGAVFAQSTGMSVAQISVFMAVAVLGGMVLQWPVGRLSDRFDRRQVLTTVTFVAAFSAFAATFVSGPLAGALPDWSLYVLVALFGGMTLPMYSLSIAHANDYLEPDQMVAASGGLVLAGGIGASFGPVTVASIMSVMGPAGFFWTLGAIHAIIGVFALYRMRRRLALPLEEQGAFVAVPPRASPIAAYLTPESPEAGELPESPEAVVAPAEEHQRSIGIKPFGPGRSRKSG